MSLTAEQLAARQKGLGGSDAAAVCGRHPSKGPATVWMQKVYPDDDASASPRAEWGNRLEAVIRDAAAERLGITIAVPTTTIRHAQHDWMLANLDGRGSDGSVVEIKCLDARRAFLLGEGDDEILPEHLYQVQHYMEVDDRDFSWVAYLVGGNDLRIYKIPRDRDLGALLIELEGEFWRRYVLTGEPPPDDSAERTSKALAARWRQDNGALIATSSGSVIALAGKVAAARAASKAADVAKAEAENALKEVIGESLGFDFGDLGKATWKATKGRPCVDTKALAAHSPEVAALVKQHTRIAPVRTLRVSLKGLAVEE